MYETNTVIVVGRLTREPEITYVGQENMALCKFSIANNPGKEEKDVSYFDITAWGKTGESINKYMKKGSQIVITGTLIQSRWQDKEGQNRSKIGITATRVQFIGSKADGNSNGNQGGDLPNPVDQSPSKNEPNPFYSIDFGGSDEEIPF